MYELIAFGILFLLGFFVGRRVEWKHFRSLEARESATLHQPVVTLRDAFKEADASHVKLVCGQVAISEDYFKRVTATIRNIFGGRLTSYEALLDRARREATLRMKNEALGADMIVNVRHETSMIYDPNDGRGRGSAYSAQAFVYGTAVWLRK